MLDRALGWNGGVAKFHGTYLRDQNLLELDDMNRQGPAKFPQDYDGLLGWPKPDWGNWEVRPVYVIDVQRIPELAAGYCYGKRIMYVGKQYYQTMAEDIYDSNMKLWKVVWVGLTPGKLDSYGEQFGAGGVIENYWDVQNDQ